MRVEDDFLTDFRNDSPTSGVPGRSDRVDRIRRGIEPLRDLFDKASDEEFWRNLERPCDVAEPAALAEGICSDVSPAFDDLFRIKMGESCILPETQSPTEIARFDEGFW